MLLREGRGKASKVLYVPNSKGIELGVKLTNSARLGGRLC